MGDFRPAFRASSTVRSYDRCNDSHFLLPTSYLNEGSLWNRRAARTLENYAKVSRITGYKASPSIEFHVTLTLKKIASHRRYIVHLFIKLQLWNLALYQISGENKDFHFHRSSKTALFFKVYAVTTQRSRISFKNKFFRARY